MVRDKWDALWGDRRQELVFIGMGMDEAHIRRRLDACLVKEQGLDSKTWSKLWGKLPDPFPAWGAQQEAA